MNLTNKRILITGGNGFVGTNAARFFSKSGAITTVAVSPRASQKVYKVDGVDILTADLTIPSAARRIVRNQDIIIHCAAVDGNLEFKRTHSAEIFSQNMRINLNMFEAASKIQIKSFIFISSSDIYLQSPEEGITEESPIDINLSSHVDGYKLAKWTSELAAREYIKQYNIPIAIIRPGNLYGPYDIFSNTRTRFIPSVISKIHKDEKVELWGDGTQTRSFLYIDDFLLVIKKILENDIKNDVFNVASKKQLSLREVIEIIGHLYNKSPQLHIDTSKPAGAHARKFDCSKLENKIGQITETPFEKGIEKTIEYYTSTLSS